MRMLDISPYYWEKMVLTMGSTLELAERFRINEKTVSKRGVAIFAKACFGYPSPSKRQKLNATG